MHLRLLPLAASAGLCATFSPLSAYAEFIQDSKASLDLRNFYMNRDFRQTNAPQNKADEWAQGFVLRLESGYTGPGTKTVSPHRARAKLDFRLVPQQRPEDILAKLRRHLDEQGFGDIRISALQGEIAARTDPSSPFVRLVRAAAQAVYQKEPVVMPTMAATGPMYLFASASAGLGLPVASAGVAYPDCRMHAPDENIRLDDFLRAIKQLATIMELMGQSVEKGV